MLGNYYAKLLSFYKASHKSSANLSAKFIDKIH